MDQQNHFCTQKRSKVLAGSHIEILGSELEVEGAGEGSKGRSSDRMYHVQIGRSTLN